MGKKYFITESQMKKVISHIKSGNEEEVLEEGLKELGMAALMMLSTVTTTLGQKHSRDPKDLAKIEKVQDLAAKELSKKEGVSYEDALKLIKQQAENFDKNYKEKLGSVDKTMKGDTDKDLSRVLVQLKHGYAIKAVHKDTISREIPPKEFVQKVDTHSVSMDGKNMFQQGSFELNSNTKQEINQVMESLGQGGRMIVGITIESSTDKERVSDHLEQRLVGMGYDSGNEGLSEVRNDKMKEFVSQNADEGIIEQDIKWEQGKGQLGAETPQDASARYVKVHFFFIEVSDKVPSPPTKEITIKTVFEMAKPIGKDSSIPAKPKYKCYKGKCANPFENVQRR
jgi:hypothetical protein